jgi:hypothetical protein
MHFQIVHMWLPRKSILSRCTSLDKVMHNKTLKLGIRWLCIGPDIKLNWKSGYVCTHTWSLSRCISEIFYITGEHCCNPPTCPSSYLFSYLCTCIWDLFHTESVTKVKSNINSVKVHAQLSNIRHPVDGALVGARPLWSEEWSFVKLFQSFRHQKPQSNSNRSYLPFIHT